MPDESEQNEQPQNDGGTPEVQANLRPGNGGVVPPVEHRWKPGQSGNPAGRKTSGAYLKEWLNVFALEGLTEADLRRIAKDPKEDHTRRGAAVRAVRLMEINDMADFAPVLNGSMTLEELRDSGVNTDAIKKIKKKTKTLKVKDGTAEQVVECEIELHDRSPDDFDRITEKTDPITAKHQHEVTVVNRPPAFSRYFEHAEN
jgi:hypothetical protein